jgi:hypothetical protein
MKINVNGASYPFPEIDTITFREASIVKNLTGLRLGEFGEAFENGDTDMMLGLAAVAVYRHSGQTDFDYLYDLNLDLIQFEVEESDTELPPAEGPASDASGGANGGPTPESDASGTPASSAPTASGRGNSTSSPRTKSKPSKTT